MDVERDQVEAALSGGAEEEIPNVVDHLRVALGRSAPEGVEMPSP